MKWTGCSSLVTILLLVVTLTLTMSFVRGKPIEMKRGKRQSDQRIAELETLLALQKYGQHRLRDWGRGRDLAPPGYGLIDFDKIGRKKKSTRYSSNADDSVRSHGWLVELERTPGPIMSSHELDQPSPLDD